MLKIHNFVLITLKALLCLALTKPRRGCCLKQEREPDCRQKIESLSSVLLNSEKLTS